MATVEKIEEKLLKMINQEDPSLLHLLANGESAKRISGRIL